MKDSSSTAPNTEQLNDAELEQIHGGLNAAQALVAKPPLGACPSCRSGLDRFLINNALVLPTISVKLPGAPI